MAWAVNIVLARPPAEVLLQELPVMAIISPIAAALVGFFNLASRQGWGIVVAVANGVWAGILSVVLSGIVFTLVVGWEVWSGPSDDYESFMRNVNSEIAPLFELVVNFPLLTETITATAILGIVTEFLHWVLVKLRRSKEDPTRQPQTGTGLRSGPPLN